MAYTEKTPNNRWRGVAKHGRIKLGTKTFDRQKDAKAWASRQEAAAIGGVDPKAGAIRLKASVTEWLDARDGVVAPLTVHTDKQLLRVLPAGLMQRIMSSITSLDVEKWYKTLRVGGYSDGSIRRFRGSLSTFFAWAVRDGRISTNPVPGATLPKVVKPPAEILPFTEAELDQVAVKVAGYDQRMAAIILIAGWTGLRWGELRSVRVGDFKPGAVPVLVVSRSHPEHSPEKVTKSGRARRVPVSERIAPLVAAFATGRGASEYLFVGSHGGQLWRHRFRAVARWDDLMEGRRIHDLRHTAACLWLGRGVDLSTVQAWLGHASVTTTSRYLHHLGMSADKAGLDLLNSGGGPYGDPVEDSELPVALEPPGRIELPTYSLRVRREYALTA